MKKALFIIIILTAFLPLMLSAQDGREDVIYLKNGTVYRGTMIEQVPGISYTIEILGGSRIIIASNDVQKITKEDKIYMLRKPKPIFHYREKGFLIYGEINLGLQFGFNLAAGYRFGQFGMLGVGAGVDKILEQRWTPGSYYSCGAYTPVFISYGGDILKKRVTPFYNIHAGYGFCFKTPNYSEGGISGSTEVTTKVQGGPMGKLELGVRFYTRHRINITLGANLTIQSATYWNNTFSEGIGSYIPGPNGGYTTVTSQTYASGAVVMYLPSFNFGIGF